MIGEICGIPYTLVGFFSFSMFGFGPLSALGKKSIMALAGHGVVGRGRTKSVSPLYYVKFEFDVSTELYIVGCV